MFWLALAAQMSLPIPTNGRVPDIRTVFTANDFPAYLLSEAPFSKTVYTRTTVRFDGTIQGCVAERSSGDARLDAYTCAIIVRRGRFSPARWDDGTAAYGVIRVPISWVAGYTVSPEDALEQSIPDLDLSVNRLPKGAHSMVGVGLEIEADEQGRPLACAELPPLPADPTKHFPELVQLACQQAMAQVTVTPAVDVSGKRVRSVQGIEVRFKLDH